jgi:hypothetical protein
MLCTVAERGFGVWWTQIQTPALPFTTNGAWVKLFNSLNFSSLTFTKPLQVVKIEMRVVHGKCRVQSSQRIFKEWGPLLLFRGWYV